ncbi:MAG: undecaprenyl-phosphate glucose phosphotransferase [Oligoflexia bacterium]|nr:undecaprenyl-phosphate glucose phosphotransferase [Oligoflexia bacterium]
MVTDSIGLVASWLLAYYLRFYTQIIPVTKGVPPFSRYVSLVVPVVLLWLVCFSYFRAYGSSKIRRRTAEFYNTIKAQFFTVAIFVAITSIVAEYRYSRVVIVYFGILSLVYLVSTRMILRNILRRLVAQGVREQKVLIIGSGSSAEGVIWKLKKMPELGAKIIGYLGEKTDSKATHLGSYSDLEKILEQNSIDHIVIALPRSESSLQNSLLKELDATTINVLLVPDLYEYITLGCSVEDFDQIPVVALNESPIDPLGMALKRVLDVLGSLLAILLFSPLFLLIAILVKLTSRGPILYGQVRMSLDGSEFKMWKFRSMKVGAEKETGAVWAKKDDDRKTRLGKILRATSLDELPQFFNVLFGDMSLVGPRPERPEFVKNFRKSVPKYMLRHKVKGGITGWAQINGWRGDTGLDGRIESDLYYIRNWSIWLDLKILLLTPLRGFVNKNAY